MPLTPCPDCGREVSTAAPACIHCGRPLAPPAAPPDARPMAGIVTACVLGLLGLAWALRPDKPASTPEMDDVNGTMRLVHLLGNTALLIGALLSLARHRAGSTLVRATSVLMLLAIPGVMLIAWRFASARAQPETLGYLAAIVLVGTAVAMAPWILYLYLFRRSRHP